MIDEELKNSLELVRDILETSESDIVIVKNTQVIYKKQGDTVGFLIKAIEELSDNLKGSIVGLRVLGKSSSLLCRYAEVKAVCSPHATKTAIALLIIGGISSQIDEMIREIDHESDIVKYERIVEKISSPEQAYKFLKESFIN